LFTRPAEWLFSIVVFDNNITTHAGDKTADWRPKAVGLDRKLSLVSVHAVASECMICGTELLHRISRVDNSALWTLCDPDPSFGAGL